MQDINIGLIGAGYMGKAHTIAYKTVRSIFPTAPVSYTHLTLPTSDLV